MEHNANPAGFAPSFLRLHGRKAAMGTVFLDPHPQLAELLLRVSVIAARTLRQPKHRSIQLYMGTTSEPAEIEQDASVLLSWVIEKAPEISALSGDVISISLDGYDPSYYQVSVDGQDWSSPADIVTLDYGNEQFDAEWSLQGSPLPAGEYLVRFSFLGDSRYLFDRVLPPADSLSNFTFLTVNQRHVEMSLDAINRALRVAESAAGTLSESDSVVLDLNAEGELIASTPSWIFDIVKLDWPELLALSSPAMCLESVRFAENQTIQRLQGFSDDTGIEMALSAAWQEKLGPLSSDSRLVRAAMTHGFTNGTVRVLDGFGRELTRFRFQGTKNDRLLDWVRQSIFGSVVVVPYPADDG